MRMMSAAETVDALSIAEAAEVIAATYRRSATAMSCLDAVGDADCRTAAPHPGQGRRAEASTASPVRG